MKSKLIVTALMLSSFFIGFQLKGMLSDNLNTKGRATSIGGIFFKCKDPVKLRNWYKENLGLNVNDYGAVFEWYQGADFTKKGFTQWSPFKETTNYFQPSTKEFMINYRVVNMESLVKELKSKKVNVVDSIEYFDYGKFVHVMDLEGNKLELWEPNDVVYEKMGVDMGLMTNK